MCLLMSRKHDRFSIFHVKKVHPNQYTLRPAFNLISIIV